MSGKDNANRVIQPERPGTAVGLLAGGVIFRWTTLESRSVQDSVGHQLHREIPKWGGSRIVPNLEAILTHLLHSTSASIRAKEPPEHHVET